MLGTDPLVLSPNVHYSGMINILERICCSELFLIQYLFVCLGWKHFCLVCYFSEFLPKKQRKLSFVVAFFIRYESGLDSRTDSLLTWLKNLQYLFFQVKCLSKTFHKSDSLTCTFIRSLLHFFFLQLSWFQKWQWWYLRFLRISALWWKLWTEGFFSNSASGLPLIFVMYSAVLSSLGTSLIIFLTCSSVPCIGVARGAM